MNEEDQAVDRAALHGFLLGTRVFSRANGIEILAKDDRTWQTLREVADGKLAIVDSAGDKIRKHPDMSPDLRDRLPDGINRLVAHDRATAERVLRAFERGSKP